MQWYLLVQCSLISLVSCSVLLPPMNGIVKCLLGNVETPFYGDTCNYTCDTGYELTGGGTRTCQSDGSWSGSDGMCERGE